MSGKMVPQFRSLVRGDGLLGGGVLGWPSRGQDVIKAKITPLTSFYCPL